MKRLQETGRDRAFENTRHIPRADVLMRFSKTILERNSPSHPRDAMAPIPFLIMLQVVDKLDEIMVESKIFFRLSPRLG
jgi:hypothetical protein